MRVKLLLALAIASVLLFCSMGVAAAATISGAPTAAQLTAAADQQMSGCGFPDLSSIDTATAAIVPQDNIEAMDLTSPICGVCGEPIPECTCTETLTVFPGPQVNLGCPIVAVQTVPVNLVSPKIRPVFPAINVAPQAIVTLPQVNTQLNCFDIECLPVTNINSCPTIKPKDC